MDNDYQHLKWLSLGFYFHAALIALFACFGFFYFYFGIVMLAGGFEHDKNPPPPFVGWLLIGMALVLIVLGSTLAICNILTGKYLKRQTNYIFCIVIAAVNCMSSPLGLVLCIFTIIVLLRESVKALFNKHQNFSQMNTPPSWQ